MKTSHTPGPWVARAVSDERFHPSKIGYDIEAHPDFNNGFPVAHVSGSADMHANARLIAASPELLVIVQRWMTWATGPVVPIAVRMALQADTEAAIAQATGQ